MDWHFTPYVFGYFVTAAISLAVAFVSWRRRTVPCGASLAWIMLAIAQWSFAGALEMAAISIPAKVFWSQVAYLGNTTSPVLLLIFALEYTHQRNWLTPRKIAAYLVLPLITIAMAVTNAWHHLVWTSFTPSPSGENLIVYGHGAWFWIFVAYAYAALSISILLIVYASIRFKGTYRRQAGMLLLGLLVPVVLNVMYVFDLSPIPGLDVTPIAFAITGWILALSIFRFHLLDLVPVARDAIIENMRDGVLVLDLQQRVVDINPIAQKSLGTTPAIIGQPVEQACPLIASRLAEPEGSAEIVLDENPPRYLDANVSWLRDQHGRAMGRLVVLRDITRRKQVDTALQEWNTRLERQVAERTAELQATVTRLQAEIAERERVETALRRMEEMLAQRVAEQSRQLATLYDVILLAGQSLTVQKMQEQLLAKVIGAMNGGAGCIHELDTAQMALCVAAHQGLPADSVASIQTMSAHGLLQDPVPRAVQNLAADSGAFALVGLANLKSYLSAPINLQDKPIGMLTVFWATTRSFSVEDIALLSAMADQIGVIVENARLRERGEQMAVLQERRRLARDLHDSVTQSLHSLVLSAETAENRLRLGKLDRLEQSLDQLAESARQALKEMRLLLFELRLASPDQINLIEALQIRLDAVERRAGIQAELIVEGVANLPKTWERELYSVAMEALNNSLRHARATQVSVRLSGVQNSVGLEITDNGKGIDSREKPMGGMGLQTMAERAERLGGALSITSAPNAGTRIHLRIEEAK